MTLFSKLKKGYRQNLYIFLWTNYGDKKIKIKKNEKRKILERMQEYLKNMSE